MSEYPISPWSTNLTGYCGEVCDLCGRRAYMSFQRRASPLDGSVYRCSVHFPPHALYPHMVGGYYLTDDDLSSMRFGLLNPLPHLGNSDLPEPDIIVVG